MDPTTAPLFEYFKLFGVGAGVFVILWFWLKEKKEEIKELKDRQKQLLSDDEIKRKEWVDRLQQVNDLRHEEALRGFDVVQSSAEAVRANTETLQSVMGVITDLRERLNERGES